MLNHLGFVFVGVADFAQWNYVEPMLFFITKMMMPRTCLLTTESASKHSRVVHFASVDFLANGIPCFPFERVFDFEIVAAFFCFAFLCLRVTSLGCLTPIRFAVTFASSLFAHFASGVESIAAAGVSMKLRKRPFLFADRALLGQYNGCSHDVNLQHRFMFGKGHSRVQDLARPAFIL